MVEDFVNGKSINQLLEKFPCTKLTIIRNLKKNLSEDIYNNLLEENLPERIQNPPLKIKDLQNIESKKNEEVWNGIQIIKKKKAKIMIILNFIQTPPFRDNPSKF